jgi:hypothetical protein
MEKAVEGGAEFMEKQKEHVAEVAAKEAERRANLPAGKYPREFDAHTHMVDETNNREFTGTQYSYNTQAEALAAIDAARAANKYVMYADPGGGSYINELSADDFRINVED